MLPKRVGLPMRSPSQRRTSSSVTNGAPSSGTARTGRSFSADTAGTVRSVARAPSTDSMPRQTCRASSAVAPWRE